MKRQTLVAYAKEQGATQIKKFNAGNGAFMSLVKPDGNVTIPVAKHSQNLSIEQYFVAITDDGQAIASKNEMGLVELDVFELA